jgi:hypothetical protein
MWVCRGGQPDRPALIYHYASSRSADVAKELFAGYSGVVQSDAQEAQGKNKKAGSMDIALGYIRKIYAIEAGKKRSQESNCCIYAKKK